MDMYFKKHITYTITTLDNQPLKKGDVIKSGETKTYKVTIRYSSPDAETLDSQFYESDIYLMYLQER